MSDLHRWPEGLEAPIDDGGASHLLGMRLPAVYLPSTGGPAVDLGHLKGWSVVYIYPMTARPGVPLPGGWDEIPGARGCTPQACGFRDHFSELKALGVSEVYGVSTQTTAYQREAAQRLKLPFQLLSDAGGDLQEMLDLPNFEAEGESLLRRLTMIARDSTIEAVFYPVFPPGRNAEDVVEWMRTRL